MYWLGFIDEQRHCHAICSESLDLLQEYVKKINPKHYFITTCYEKDSIIFPDVMLMIESK